MPGPVDLERWYRSPANVTGHELLAEAKRRGWKVRGQTGDHMILEKPGFAHNLAIDLGTKASGTKRNIIRTMMEAESE